MRLLLALLVTTSIHAAQLQIDFGFEQPRWLPSDQVTSLHVNVLTSGPEPVHNIRVAFTPVAGATIDGLTSTNATCAGDTCTLAQLNNGQWIPIDVALHTGAYTPAVKQGFEVTVTADDAGAPQAKSLTISVAQPFTVTNTLDDGPGSLRQTILDANTRCGDDYCVIGFAIPQPAPLRGWFTIVPRSPLPMIDARRVIVDGSTQARLTGDTNVGGPEIEINGGEAGENASGLQIKANCVAQVSDLAINGFSQWGLDVLNGSIDCAIVHSVERNVIGSDPAGRVIKPNLRGLRADGMIGTVRDNLIMGNRRSGVWKGSGYLDLWHNVIALNGASGVYLGPGVNQAGIRNNMIVYNGEMGVAVSDATSGIKITQNSFRGNGGLAIDRGLDGADGTSEEPSHPNAPILLSAVYDRATNTTDVSYEIHHVWNSYQNLYGLEIYASDDPRSGGEEIVGYDTLTFQPGTRHAKLRGDFTGKWITAISQLSPYIAKTGDPFSTSEFSNPVLVTR
jgi:hypothetical protein